MNKNNKVNTLELEEAVTNKKDSIDTDKNIIMKPPQEFSLENDENKSLTVSIKIDILIYIQSNH